MKKLQEALEAAERDQRDVWASRSGIMEDIMQAVREHLQEHVHHCPRCAAPLPEGICRLCGKRDE